PGRHPLRRPCLCTNGDPSHPSLPEQNLNSGPNALKSQRADNTHRRRRVQHKAGRLYFVVVRLWSKMEQGLGSNICAGRRIAVANRPALIYLRGECINACGKSMPQPLVAVSTDVRQFENYTWHAAPQQYLEAAISVAGVLPVLVPSFGERLDFDELLSSVDGVLLTGSKSNVHPSYYGGDASEANGPYDEARDATTLPLIRKAIKRGVPLLAICR